MAHWKDDALLKIDRISWIASPKYPVPEHGDHTIVPEDDPMLHVSSEEDPENWHVQVTNFMIFINFLQKNSLFLT